MQRPQSYLQVAVAAAGATPALVQVTPGRTVEEVTVVVTAAVLVQDVSHLWLEERHVHVDGHDLQETKPRLSLSSSTTFLEHFITDATHPPSTVEDTSFLLQQ